MNKPFVHEAGYWLSGEEGHFSPEQGYFFDASLAGELTLLLEGMSVCDIGCGLGKYVQWLRDRGFDSDGYDGNPNTRELTRGLCSTLNFAEPVRLSRRYDAVMSFEVGEHIPKQFEESFIDNVASHARRLVVLSWAVPGQDGDGHVNCRSNLHIIRQFNRRGFRFEPLAAQMLRANCSLYWFKQTLLVFSRRRAPYSWSEWRAWFKILDGDLDRLKPNNRSNSPLFNAAVGKLVRTCSDLNADRRKLVNKWRLLHYNLRRYRIGEPRGSGSAVSFFPICFTRAADFEFLRLSILSLCRSAANVKEIHIYSDPADPLSRSQMDQIRDDCKQPLVFHLAKYRASIYGPQVRLNELYACEQLLQRMPDDAYLMKFDTDVLFVSARVFQEVSESNRAAVNVGFPGLSDRQGPAVGCCFVRARELRGMVGSRVEGEAAGIYDLSSTLSGIKGSETGQGTWAVERIADGFSSSSSTDGAATAAAVRRLSTTSSLVSFRDPQSRIVDKARMQLAAEAVLGALPASRNPYSELAPKQS